MVKYVHHLPIKLKIKILLQSAQASPEELMEEKFKNKNRIMQKELEQPVVARQAVTGNTGDGVGCWVQSCFFLADCKKGPILGKLLSSNRRYCCCVAKRPKSSSRTSSEACSSDHSPPPSHHCHSRDSRKYMSTSPSLTFPLLLC